MYSTVFVAAEYLDVQGGVDVFDPTSAFALDSAGNGNVSATPSVEAGDNSTGGFDESQCVNSGCVTVVGDAKSGAGDSNKAIWGFVNASLSTAGVVVAIGVGSNPLLALGTVALVLSLDDFNEGLNGNSVIVDQLVDAFDIPESSARAIKNFVSWALILQNPASRGARSVTGAITQTPVPTSQGLLNPADNVFDVFQIFGGLGGNGAFETVARDGGP